MVVRLTGFDMNLLVALDALLSEQSVSRAAERLSVGQPAMSATLGRLRAVFGDPLLVRAGRGLQRTAFADSLVEPLAELLRDTERLLDLGSVFDPATDRRTFTIIASDYVALVLLRPLLERLATIAPAVVVQVRPVDINLLEQLRRGTADIAIYPSELVPADMPFRSELLFDDDFVCAAHIDNELLDGELTVEQLSSAPYLAASQGALASLADQRLDEAHVSRRTAMVAQSFVTAPFLLPGTQMYTIIQRRLASLLMPEAQFKILRPPVALAELHELMIWSPRRGADAGHAWLREQLRRTADLLG